MSVSMPSVNDFDAERLRIARDLHDVISYGFATISLQAGAAASVVDQKPEQALEALHSIKDASKAALEEIRGILGLLRQTTDSAAPIVGLDGLDGLVETTTIAGVPTRLKVSGQMEALPAAVSRAAYRIVQEALANVLRHAGDASAAVAIVNAGERLLITVEDDGEGLDGSLERASTGSGFGILGMRERALSLGGDLEAGPRLEGGFRVSAYLPMPAAS